MKKSILKILVVAFMALPLIQSVVFAEGNYTTLRVSCTIPAIPGVNAPPFETKSIQTQGTKQTDKSGELLTKKEQEKNSSKSIFIVKKEEDSTKAVKTVYSR